MTSFSATKCSCLVWALSRNSYFWHFAIQRIQFASCFVGLLNYSYGTRWQSSHMTLNLWAIVVHFLSEIFPLIFQNVGKWGRDGIIKESVRETREREDGETDQAQSEWRGPRLFLSLPLTFLPQSWATERPYQMIRKKEKQSSSQCLFWGLTHISFLFPCTKLLFCLLFFLSCFHFHYYPFFFPSLQSLFLFLSFTHYLFLSQTFCFISFPPSFFFC